MQQRINYNTSSVMDLIIWYGNVVKKAFSVPIWEKEVTVIIEKIKNRKKQDHSSLLM